ncbi:hypothetical protein GCM10027075_21160 [Streptomyces heilongjiangensis]
MNDGTAPDPEERAERAAAPEAESGTARPFSHPRPEGRAGVRSTPAHHRDPADADGTGGNQAGGPGTPRPGDDAAERSGVIGVAPGRGPRADRGGGKW